MNKEKQAEDSAERDVYQQVTDFIYETAIHSKTPRSGLWFLGSGKQSVAEHLFHTAMIAYVLVHLEPEADERKVMLMALFHDIGEGRTADHNYVHQRYGKLAEAEAVKDISQSIPFGGEIFDLFDEMERGDSLEAKLVHDADQLEWMTTLRAEEVKGNDKAKDWNVVSLARLKTPAGKRLGERILTTHPDAWWFDAEDDWFVDRKLEDRRWKKGKD